MMRAFLLASSVAGLLLTGPLHAAIQYPLAVTLDAQFKSGVTSVTSKVTISVDRPMVDALRTRVTDALKYGGYPNFLNTLRPLPQVGSIETQSAKVVVRYTREEQDGAGSRLVLVADRPLFFLSGDQTKAKAGFELTIVDLRFDGQGGITGQLAGAARVKPAPDGSVILDTYAEEPVQLKASAGKP
jgi:hypothetical protein